MLLYTVQPLLPRDRKEHLCWKVQWETKRLTRSGWMGIEVLNTSNSSIFQPQKQKCSLKWLSDWASLWTSWQYLEVLDEALACMTSMEIAENVMWLEEQHSLTKSCKMWPKMLKKHFFIITARRVSRVLWLKLAVRELMVYGSCQCLMSFYVDNAWDLTILGRLINYNLRSPHLENSYQWSWIWTGRPSRLSSRSAFLTAWSNGRPRPPFAFRIKCHVLCDSV